MQDILQDLITLSGWLEEDCQILRQNAAQTQKWADEVVKEFYDTLYSYANTARVFQEGERPHREETLREWYMEVTSGEINLDFWQRQWFVGLIHIKRGVDNHFVLGILSRVQQLFLKNCLEEFAPAQGQRLFHAFERVTNVIAGLIVQGYHQQYLSAVERMSGIKVNLIDRMALSEATQMVAELRQNKAN